MKGKREMIKGIGIDLIELDRISRIIKKKPRFVQRILTERERETYKKITSNQRKREYIAGRYAAKEAFAKAAGVGIGRLSFQHIEVLSNEKGAPVLTAKGYEKNTIFISITHSKDFAAAQVVIAD